MRPEGYARPTYENRQTQLVEEEVIKEVSSKWKTDYEKLPIKYIVDYALLRNLKIRAFVEVKWRTTPYNQYPDYNVSLHKYNEMIKLRQVTNLFTCLVVKWSDIIKYHVPVKESKYTIKMGGNKNRGDWQDYEPMIHIPLEDFKDL